MFLFIYLTFIVVVILFFNHLLLKKNILINETGEIHQKFTSKSRIPLTGGTFLFLGSLYYLKYDINSLILFLFLILSLGIFSDLKLIKSAFIRLLFQISLVLSFIIFNDIQILKTKVYLIDKFLEYDYFNYFFVSFCILIVINGSNFMDGLNTLGIGYYLIIGLIVFYLSLDQQISSNEFNISHFLIILFVAFVLNFFNSFFLGDSGSYLLGFIFSILLISYYKWNPYISPFYIVLLLWYPCFETLFSIIRKKILKRSVMSPDSNHLHQLIFFYLKKRTKMKVFYTNLITANMINLYNFIIFILASNFIYNSKIQIIFILLNLIIYTAIYFKLFNYRVKKI
tara:strand:+ start:220 stop:1242 length:1023 start_codon:yes stop_codon:yes gene_type:complete